MSQSEAGCLMLAGSLEEAIDKRVGSLSCRLHHVLYFIDIAFMALSALSAYVVLGLGGTLEGNLKYALVVFIAVFAFSLFGFQSGLYDWHRFRLHLKRPVRPLAAVIFSFGCLLVIGFVFKSTDEFSRLWSGIWFTSMLIYVFVSRFALYYYLLRPEQRHRFNRRAIILNAGAQGQSVLDHLRRYNGREITVVGFLDDDPGEALPKSYRGVPILGRVDQLEQALLDSGADLAIIALPWSERGRIDAFIKRLSSWAIDIYMAPEPLGLDYADRPMHRIGGMHLLSLRDRPIGEWNAVVKRVEDLMIAVPALILLSPLLALIALAIRLESRGAGVVRSGALWVQR
jgi:polysaccharide biosynthesis protein PslA